MLRHSLAILLLLASCSPPGKTTPAQAYRYSRDRMLVMAGVYGTFGLYPCARERTENGTTIVERVPDEQCYRFRPPERIDAIWHNEFEGSMLVTREELARGVYADGQRTRWFSPQERNGWWKPLCGNPEGCPDGDYHIVFIGRRTAADGAYGHMGGSDEIVLLDRLISLEPLDPKGSGVRRRP